MWFKRFSLLVHEILTTLGVTVKCKTKNKSIKKINIPAWTKYCQLGMNKIKELCLGSKNKQKYKEIFKLTQTA